MKAVGHGAAAASAGAKLTDCPYTDGRRRYWRLGFNIRVRAERRRESYPDKVEAEIERARLHLDEFREPGKLRPSEILALSFYMFGSRDPDAAFAQFTSRMREARRRYSNGCYANPLTPDPVPRANLRHQTNARETAQ